MKVDRRGSYGFDTPSVPLSFAVAALVSLAVAIVCVSWSMFWEAGLAMVIAVFLALSAFSFLWTTRRGKFLVWAELLDALSLKGDEHLLDVGCGRGAVLTLAAERLGAGRAEGIDLWSATDQSGNRQEVTLHNAELEGVRDRVGVHTGDMRKLPFPDQSFDIVTSSLAIHNIRDEPGRRQAIAEILRVLKPGGDGADRRSLVHLRLSAVFCGVPRRRRRASTSRLAVLVRRTSGGDELGDRPAPLTPVAATSGSCRPPWVENRTRICSNSAASRVTTVRP